MDVEGLTHHDHHPHRAFHQAFPPAPPYPTPPHLARHQPHSYAAHHPVHNPAKIFAQFYFPTLAIPWPCDAAITLNA